MEIRPPSYLSCGGDVLLLYSAAPDLAACRVVEGSACNSCLPYPMAATGVRRGLALVAASSCSTAWALVEVLCRLHPAHGLSAAVGDRGDRISFHQGLLVGGAQPV